MRQLRSFSSHAARPPWVRTSIICRAPTLSLVVQAGRVDVNQEDPARRFHQDVPLAPERHLGCIEASAKSARACCPCCLRIGHGSGLVASAPSALSAVRTSLPVAATSVDAEAAWRRKKLLQRCSFRVTQVGRIRSIRHAPLQRGHARVTCELATSATLPTLRHFLEPRPRPTSADLRQGEVSASGSLLDVFRHASASVTSQRATEESWHRLVPAVRTWPSGRKEGRLGPARQNSRSSSWSSRRELRKSARTKPNATAPVVRRAERTTNQP